MTDTEKSLITGEEEQADAIHPTQEAGSALEEESLVGQISTKADTLGEEDDEESARIDDNLIVIESFEELNLSTSLLEAIKKLGWSKPTTIQGLSLPHSIEGQDLAGFSQTGTGKTGVFLITIAHQILKLRETVGDNSPHPKAIILAPTRELAVQISQDAESLFQQLDISIIPVFGGVDYEKQAQQIRKGVQVIVATPGRLRDYFQKKVFSTKDCCLFICDEADRMLDMGFIDDVEFFLSQLSPETQKLLFSATTNEQVKELAFEYLENPKYISANPEIMTPERIEQHAVVCDSSEKLRVLMGLFRNHAPVCSIIFVNTKIVAEWLHYKLLGNGIEVDLITGDLPQKKRIELIHRIKAGQVKALIATDVASRGLHIAGITHVYNFDLPDEAANYVHRIGRTARAGAFGSSYSLVCEDYGHNLIAIQKYLGENISIQIENFPEEFLAIEDKAENPYKDKNFKGYRMRDDEASKASGRRQGRGDGNGRTIEARGKGRGRNQEHSAAQSPETQKDQKAASHQARRDEKKGDGELRRPSPIQAKKSQGSQPVISAKGPSKGHHRKPKLHTQADGKVLKIIAPKQKELVPTTFFGLMKKIVMSLFPWLRRKK